jgi:hypothetical protein
MWFPLKQLTSFGRITEKFGARRLCARGPRLSATGAHLSRSLAHPEDDINLYRVERPVLFYGNIAVMLLILSLILAIPLIVTYVQTGLVPRQPTAILITGLGILASLSFFSGVILDTVTRGRREMLSRVWRPESAEPGIYAVPQRRPHAGFTGRTGTSLRRQLLQVVSAGAVDDEFIFIALSRDQKTLT